MVKKLWNKNFILLLQGSAVSIIGDLMYSVAIGYWVYQKTGSNGLMGTMSSISMFVTMLLSPFSGTIVDRLNRKWVLVIGDMLQGIIMLTVGVFAFLDKLNVVGVLIAAFLAALGGVFYSPASNTVLVDIIPGDEIQRGQSLFSGVNTSINLVGTAFSGAVVALLGVPLIIIINGASNIYAAVSELFVSVPKTVKQGQKVTIKSILADTKTALKTIFKDKCLKIFIPCAIIINFLSAGAFALILPFTIEKGFALEQYGLLMSICTVGALIAVVLLGAIKFSPKARYLILAITFPLGEIFMLTAYLQTEFALTCVFGLLGMLTNTAGNTVFNAAMMVAIPKDSRGAILGFVSSASVGGSALSALAYGFLGEIFPLETVFSVGCVLGLIPMLYMCLNRRTKRFIVENTEEQAQEEASEEAPEETVNESIE
ncbi:MAG: MFS transporter [Clostridia bacterium]|nr:MFS transporter [Clostridia bacterium]